MRRKTKKKDTKGFSLIEVIVAIAVLTIGLIGVMALYSDSLSRILSIRSQTTANSLAQEGIELVRNIADTAEGNLTVITSGNKKVSINSSSVVEMVDTPGDYSLYYAPNGTTPGRFTHNSSDETTRFQRKIIVIEEHIDDLPDAMTNDDRKVISLVSWGGVEPPDTTAACTVADRCVFAIMELINNP